MTSSQITRQETLAVMYNRKLWKGRTLSLIREAVYGCQFGYIGWCWQMRKAVPTVFFSDGGHEEYLTLESLVDHGWIVDQ